MTHVCHTERITLCEHVPTQSKVQHKHVFRVDVFGVETLVMANPKNESRILAIGDVHGNSAALERLLAKMRLRPHDTLVMLGDVINRGNDTRGVIEQLIAVAKFCNLVCILGNHEEVLLEVLRRPEAIEQFLSMGGDSTLASYGDLSLPQQLPSQHLEFIGGFVPYFETPNFIFVHANYCWYMPMDEQPGSLLRWTSIEDESPKAHTSGKIVICGHSPGLVRDLVHCICIDTGCGFGGVLTGLDLHNRQLFHS